MSSSRDKRRESYEQLVGSTVADGRFLITSLLGFGGMGAVYEATQLNMNRQVALKLIPTHDPTTVARFEREAFTISKLRHPNTVTVFDFGQADHFLFLSMELLEGKTLTEVIKEGPVAPERAVHIATQVARSLAEAHRNGIVHRDVKPDNIILITVDDDHDVVKVLDFGIAKAVLGEDDVQLTGDGRIIGTPRYMSPEQILAEPVDLRSDIYSLGCIMFEMLCGAPPFQQSSTTALMISHTQDPPPAFAQRLEPTMMSRMPAGLERVVRKGLNKNPNHRQQNCDELREELERALEGLLTGVDSDEFVEERTRAAIPASIERSGPQPISRTPTFSTQFPTEPESKPKGILLVAVMILVAIAFLGLYVALRTPDEVAGPVDPIAELENKLVENEKEDDTSPNEETPKMVTLKIESTPTGASIYDGNRALGITPKEIAVPSDAGSINYRLELENHTPEDIVVNVNPNKDVQSERYRLKKIVASKKKPTKTKIRPKKTPKKETKEKEGKKTPKVKMIEDDKPKVERLD